MIIIGNVNAIKTNPIIHKLSESDKPFKNGRHINTAIAAIKKDTNTKILNLFLVDEKDINKVINNVKI